LTEDNISRKIKDRVLLLALTLSGKICFLLNRNDTTFCRVSSKAMNSRWFEAGISFMLPDLFFRNNIAEKKQ
jgi:hypothetical protein